MESTKEVEFYLKNAYRALLELVKCLPEGDIAPKELAVYDYLTGEYCYCVLSTNQEEICLKIYQTAEAFVNYLEAKKESTNDFYTESALIAQEYIAVYFVPESGLSQAAQELYQEYAFKWRGYWPLFCYREQGKAEKVLWDKNLLICLSGVLERLHEMLHQKSWAEAYLRRDNQEKPLQTDSILLWDYRGAAGWQKRPLALSEIYAKLDSITYEDSFLMKKIAHKQSDEMIYEMSWFYIPIEQNIGYESYYPRYANLVNLDDGQVLFSVLGTPAADEFQIIEALTQNIAKQEKKPGYIMTADYSLWRYLEDFCAKCGINLRLIEQGFIKDRISEGFQYMLSAVDKSDKNTTVNNDRIVDLKSYRQKFDKS